MDQPPAQAQIEQWIADFDQSLATSNVTNLQDLFAEVSYLRDNGALTWDFRQFHGRDAVLAALLGLNKEVKPHNFVLSSHWPKPRAWQEADGRTVVEAFADFETTKGIAVAVLQVVVHPTSPQKLQVFALYTRLENLKAFKGPQVHPRANGYTPSFDGQSWKQNHNSQRQYEDNDPEVLIVGAGQAGVMVTAHLVQLGVKTLVVDKNERVGDNWYKRYDGLKLHNPVEMNGFPYLPFPKHYPEYLSKDLLGQWLEIYSAYLDLNIWTSTEFVQGEFNDYTKKWSATLKTANGDTRIISPREIILATGGIGGKPVVPSLPGLDSFKGQVMHSSKYTKASDHGTKKAVIVGAATSAHDIAEDMYDNKVEVTMLQRGPVVINNIETANLAYTGYLDPSIPTELVDIQYGIGLINPLREAKSKIYHSMTLEKDAELLNGLAAAGLRLGNGVDGMGWLDLFLRTGGGYYFNKGASEYIVNGGIKIEQYSRVVEFVAEGVRLDDGHVIEADLVILATGYQNRKAEVIEQFGNGVAERVGDIARLDEEGEWANMWGQTGQRGLWFNGGGINQARPGSRRLALLVKADLDGLISENLRRPPKNGIKEPEAPRPHI